MMKAFLSQRTILLKLLMVGAFLAQVPDARASCFFPQLPSSFEVDERFFEIGTDFDLKDTNGKSLGQIKERLLHLRKRFEYLDSHGNTVATGEKRLFSWGWAIDVYDCEGQLIGTVKQKILRSFFSFSNHYEILNPDGNEIATSQETEFFGTTLTLQNSNGDDVVKMKRPYINFFTESWDVSVHKTDGIDPRVLMMLPAFKTSDDKDRKEEEKKKKERERQEEEEEKEKEKESER